MPTTPPDDMPTHKPETEDPADTPTIDKIKKEYISLTSITIFWTEVELHSCIFEKYMLEMQIAEAEFTEVTPEVANVLQLNVANKLTCTVTDLPPATIIKFRVTVICNADTKQFNSQPSPQEEATTLERSDPPVITKIGGGDGDTSDDPNNSENGRTATTLKVWWEPGPLRGTVTFSKWMITLGNTAMGIPPYPPNPSQVSGCNFEDFELRECLIKGLNPDTEYEFIVFEIPMEGSEGPPSEMKLSLIHI